MRTTSGLVATVGAVCLLAGPLLSAQQAPAGQTPSFRSGTEIVTIDVGVVDKTGVPVRGLNAGDFTVTVEGVPRRVVNAEFVEVVSATEEALRPDIVPISTNQGGFVGRQFVFVVDQNTLEPGSAHRVATAAASFFSGLSFADRSALMVLPVGTRVPFTWAHSRVRDALQRVPGLSTQGTTFELGSLTEARDISNASMLALRTVGDRECRGSSTASATNATSTPINPISGGTTPTAPTSPTGGGATPAGETGGTPTAPTGPGTTTSGGTSGNSGSRGSSASPLGFGLDACRRDVQVQAEMAWRTAQIMAMSSLTSLRNVLASLAHVPGDKTLLLISGGWPLEDREVTSLVSTVASDALAARVTIFTLFVPPSGLTASRRTISVSTTLDHHLVAWPLEALAGMTGGAPYRAEVGADAAFERMRREISGYYRIGVEKTTPDQDGKGRRLKVVVSRSGSTVRARGIFDVRTYEDRDWAARMNAALDSPTPATGVGLRMTSYLTAASEADAVNIVIAGEASRLQPGDATFRVLVRDLEGKQILSTEKPLGEATADVLPFTMTIPVAEGRYIVRMAVMDSAGHVGSIDHRVEARAVPLGRMSAAVSATPPLLVRVASGGGEPRLALDGVRQDERLALQVDLDGGRNLTGTDVTFEIASSADGPALVRTKATLGAGQHGGVLAQGVADMRVLPPGSYFARAHVSAGNDALGSVARKFNVIDVPKPTVDATMTSATIVERASTATLASRVSSAALLPFALDQALAPEVLGGFVDRVAARPDASDAMRDMLTRAGTGEFGALTVTDAQAAADPVASFVKGLSLLSQRKLDPAANAFRAAMRASSDFYPAMVYLGVCYAAGGNDKEAAGAWRTALIKEGDALPLHVMLTDALLRQGRADLALQTVESARARWPDSPGLKRRFAVAALLADKYPVGLQAVEQLIEEQNVDEPSLILALRILYDGFVSGQPIASREQDREQMNRFADVYRARGGPSLTLVDAWMAAVARKH